MLWPLPSLSYLLLIIWSVCNIESIIYIRELLLFSRSFVSDCDPKDRSTPGFPVLHYLLKLAYTHVRWVCDAIQPSHPLSFSSPFAFNFSPHQGLFWWVVFSHQVTKVLELQLQHQSFQWIFRVYFLWWAQII